MELLAPPQTQNGGPSLVSHPWLLIQYQRFRIVMCYPEVKI